MWYCVKCFATNSDSDEYCWVCGRKKKNYKGKENE
jgi:ribosomal protein L40E